MMLIYDKSWSDPSGGTQISRGGEEEREGVWRKKERGRGRFGGRVIYAESG
jgi:hypothetical protein